MSNSSEYNTVIFHTPDLRLAVRFDLIALSGELLAANLISPDNESELRNARLSVAERAAKLVEMIQTKIKLNSRHFYTFLDILRKDQRHSDILHKLNTTLSHHQARAQGLSSAIGCDGNSSDKLKQKPGTLAQSVQPKEREPTASRSMTKIEADSSTDNPGYYRGELNRLSQTKVVDGVQYEDIPCEQRFKSTLTLKHLPSGRTIVGRSPQAESKKATAQEQAAKNALSQIQNIERRQVHVHAQRQTIVVNDTKTSKSELHEYYAKKYKGASQVRYETEPLSAGGGFKSKVICGDGLQAEGSGQSKAAAEQKAAQNVMKKLGK